MTKEQIERTYEYFLAMCDESDGPDVVMLGRMRDLALRAASPAAPEREELAARLSVHDGPTGSEVHAAIDAARRT